MREPTPFRFIRETVFGEPKAMDFASAVGIDGGHLSRLENGVGAPSHDLMCRVRKLALERHLPWSDSFFFEVPTPDEAVEPGTTVLAAVDVSAAEAAHP